MTPPRSPFSPPRPALAAPVPLRDEGRAEADGTGIPEAPSSLPQGSVPVATPAGGESFAGSFMADSLREHLEIARGFCEADLPLEAANEIQRCLETLDLMEGKDTEDEGIIEV